MSEMLICICRMKSDFAVGATLIDNRRGGNDMGIEM